MNSVVDSVNELLLPALALQPSFIVCDESVSALDVSVQAQVLNLLNDLKKAFSFTAIFISHDLSVVKYISDRIMVMRAGKIEESGDAESVYHQPQTAYTRQLIDAIPGLKTELFAPNEADNNKIRTFADFIKNHAVT